MGQERKQSETARIIAVQSLKHELELAVRLLLQVKEARATVAIEEHVIDSARSAFRHAVEALDRVPQLPPKEMEAVQRLIDEFRAALSEL
jgi:hypothetical protein